MSTARFEFIATEKGRILTIGLIGQLEGSNVHKLLDVFQEVKKQHVMGVVISLQQLDEINDENALNVFKQLLASYRVLGVKICLCHIPQSIEAKILAKDIAEASELADDFGEAYKTLAA